MGDRTRPVLRWVGLVVVIVIAVIAAYVFGESVGRNQASTEPLIVATPTPTAIPPSPSPTPVPASTNAATMIDAPASQSAPTPCPGNVATSPPSLAWQYPEGAIGRAANELGQGYGLGHPLKGDKAVIVRNLYSLVTAEVGCYNEDTQGFYPWLKDFFAAYSGAYPEGEPPLDAQKGHLEAQLHAALHEPDSPIGQKIRYIAAGLDELRPGNGLDAYWDYVIAPSIYPFFSPSLFRAYHGIFQSLKQDYVVEMVSNPTGAPDFGSYLAQQGYKLGFALPSE